eukprot:804889-Pelagomonas_calceolata.AAC.1
MAQLTDAVRALLGHSHDASGMVGVDLLGSPASHGMRAVQSMGMGIPVGGGFLGSSQSSGFSSSDRDCGLSSAKVPGGRFMGNISGLKGGNGSSRGGGLQVGGAGGPWGDGLFGPWQGCSIQGHAQGHACHPHAGFFGEADCELNKFECFTQLWPAMWARAVAARGATGCAQILDCCAQVLPGPDL